MIASRPLRGSRTGGGPVWWHRGPHCGLPRGPGRPSDAPATSVGRARQAIRSVLAIPGALLAIAGALLATAAVPGLAASRAGAAPAGAAATSTARSELRSELQDYLDTYREAEHISAVSLAVSFAGGRAGISLAVGRTRYGGGGAVSPHALWQIGSNTKAFTSVLVLQLAAEHKLSINDKLDRWLPQYPAWGHVTIKQLLDMTSGIPSYVPDSPAFWSALAASPNRHFSTSALVSYAQSLAPTHGYSYSNTNYLLLQMIIERATHQSYASLLRKRIVEPLGLRNTFYSATDYDKAVTDRLPAGYWFVPAVPEMTSQIGKDQSGQSLSWAQGAGGIVSSLQDLGKWDRALFTGRELPRQQQRELTSLVSTATGQPIRTTTLADPAGYGLGVNQVTTTTSGTEWSYEGETDGFRVLNNYVPASGTTIEIGVNSATLSDHLNALGASVFQTLHKAGLS